MTQITINEVVIPNYHGGGFTATVRVYSNQNFLTSDGVRIFKQKPGGPVWYKQIACTVVGSNLTIPEFVLDSTTDSDQSGGTYTAILFDDTGMQKDFLFKRYAVPISLGLIISFAQLVAFNPQDPVRSDAAMDQAAALIRTSFDEFLEQSFPVCQLEANQAFTSNDVLADTLIACNVEEGGHYEFEAMLHVTANVVGGIQLCFGGTSTDDYFIAQYTARASTGGAVISGGRSVNRSTALNVTGTAVFAIEINGAVEIDEGGTFLIRAAQSVSNGSATTILRGVTMKMRKTN
jgi:hypothetical protein